MTIEDHSETDVLIIGAGPTGLAAACDARRHGLSLRLVERRAARAPESKALVVHARTMEVFDRLGCANDLLPRGAVFRALHLHTTPEKRATRVDLENLAWGDTKYPFWLSLPQFEVERVLEDHAAKSGAAVEWSTELVALSQTSEHVDVELRGSDGSVRRHRARWVLGCDGGRSTTRELIGASLARSPLGVSFALADVVCGADVVEDEGHVVLADEGLLLIVPMPAPGVWRLIAQIDDAAPTLDAASWNALVHRRSGLDLRVQSLGWSSRFALTSGVADRIRRGRVFLLGDAAHVHSPVGGQGLNTGVQDAHNLIWKLALVARGDMTNDASASLLDSYEVERHAGAVAMVRTTERATRLLTSRTPLLRRLVRLIGPRLARSSLVANRLGRGVGMLDLLTDGQPRLPNPELSPGVRLHDRVASLRPVEVEWNERRLLVRPDGVVARTGAVPSDGVIRVGQIPGRIS